MYWQQHYHGYSNDIDWQSMHCMAAVNNTIHKRVQMMKLMHNMLVFQHKKTSWGICQPHTNFCAFCGKLGETQQHIFSCTHDKVVEIKQELYKNIAHEILSNMSNEHKKDMPADMLAWIQTHMSQAWDHTSDDIPKTHDICIDTCVRGMRANGAERAWAGQVSQHALELITELT